MTTRPLRLASHPPVHRKFPVDVLSHAAAGSCRRSHSAAAAVSSMQLPFVTAAHTPLTYRPCRLPFVTAAHTPILWTVGLGQTLSLHPDLCLTPATSQHFTAASISAQHSHSTSQQPAQPQYLTAASTATVPHSSQHSQYLTAASISKQYNTAVQHSSHHSTVQRVSLRLRPLSLRQHSRSVFCPSLPVSPTPPASSS